MNIISTIADALSILNFLKPLSKRITKWKFKKCNYYYNNFNKKTYVDSDGNGVIVVSYELVVLNPLKTNAVYIDLNISDSQDECKLPPFSEMQEKDLKPFKDYKFSVYSRENIIQEVKESYENMSTTEFKIRKKSKKHLGIKICLLQHTLKKNGVYHISYMFSIPKMFTIENGYLGGTTDIIPLSSNSSFDTRFNNLKCSLYLSTLIHLDGNIEPDLVDTNNNHSKNIPIKQDQSMLYNKYMVEIKKIYKYSSFGFTWNVQEKGVHDGKIDSKVIVA